MAKALTVEDVRSFLEPMFEEDLHAKRILSLSMATAGAMKAAALSIHAIGHGLAKVEHLNDKHTTKQVDRLLSNVGVDVWALFAAWVPYCLAERTEAVVAIDWTEFAKDDHATIAAYLVSSHGRPTPLVWKTVKRSAMRGRRAGYEDEVLERLREVIPKTVRVTILADRGFADAELYPFLGELGFDFVVRFRKGIEVTSATGDKRTAEDWLWPNGRVRHLPGALITQARTPIAAVVISQQKAMKDPWCLVSSRADLTGAETNKLYGRRFTIEEGFRDTKDPRFGFGLAATKIGDAGRRDRLLLIGALTIALLTVLGAAGESLGYDRMLKSNTSTKRQHSLLTQGWHYFGHLEYWRPEKAEPILNRFAELLLAHPVFRATFGVL